MKRLLMGLVVLAAMAYGATAEAIESKITLSVGSTFAAAGDPGDGGPSVSLSALWPFHPGFEAGVMFFAEDVGHGVGTLRDPNDPSLMLGAVQTIQRISFGGAWRFDAAMHGNAWTPFVSATYGYYRVQSDRLGIVSNAHSASGAGLGLGVRRELASFMDLGLSARYHQLSSDELERYVQLSIDTSVRWGQ